MLCNVGADVADSVWVSFDVSIDTWGGADGNLIVEISTCVEDECRIGLLEGDPS